VTPEPPARGPVGWTRSVSWSSCAVPRWGGTGTGRWTPGRQWRAGTGSGGGRANASATTTDFLLQTMDKLIAGRVCELQREGILSATAVGYQGTAPW